MNVLILCLFLVLLKTKKNNKPDTNNNHKTTKDMIEINSGEFITSLPPILSETIN